MTGGGAAAAFFDLDRTLVGVTSERALARRLLRAGLIGRLDLALIALGYARYDLAPPPPGGHGAAKRALVRRVFAGKPVAACEAAAARAVEEELTLALLPGALHEIACHRAAGRRVFVVSAALDLVAEPLAWLAGADGLACTRLARDGTGRTFTGEVLGQVPSGPGKAAALRRIAVNEGVDLCRSHAYGDHHDDGEMLAAVGHPVAVNPGPRLAAMAHAGAWRVVAWQ